MTESSIAISHLIGRSCTECFYKVAKSNLQRMFSRRCIYGHHIVPLPEEMTCKNWQAKFKEMQWLEN